MNMTSLHKLHSPQHYHIKINGDLIQISNHAHILLDYLIEMF